MSLSVWNNRGLTTTEMFLINRSATQPSQVCLVRLKIPNVSLRSRKPLRLDQVQTHPPSSCCVCFYRMFVSLCSQLRSDFSSVCGSVQEESALFWGGQREVQRGSSKWPAEDLQRDMSPDVNDVHLSQWLITTLTARINHPPDLLWGTASLLCTDPRGEM